MQFSPARNDRRQNQPDASTFHSPRDTADRFVVFTRWGLGCEAQTAPGFACDGIRTYTACLVVIPEHNIYA